MCIRDRRKADSLYHGHGGEHDAHRAGCAGSDLADEKGIRHIIDGGHQHADNRWNRQPRNQCGNRRFDHLYKTFFLCHRFLHLQTPPSKLTMTPARHPPEASRIHTENR